MVQTMRIMSTNPGPQNMFTVIFKTYNKCMCILYNVHLCSNSRNILLTVFKFGTKVPFFSSLKKYISKDNPITLTPVMLVGCGGVGVPQILLFCSSKGCSTPFSHSIWKHMVTEMLTSLITVFLSSLGFIYYHFALSTSQIVSLNFLKYIIA